MTCVRYDMIIPKTPAKEDIYSQRALSTVRDKNNTYAISHNTIATRQLVLNTNLSDIRAGPIMSPKQMFYQVSRLIVYRTCRWTFINHGFIYMRKKLNPLTLNNPLDQCIHRINEHITLTDNPN